MENQEGQSGDFQKEEHQTTCSKCGAETTVPFKPTEGRPVYCRDCYKEMKQSSQDKPKE